MYFHFNLAQIRAEVPVKYSFFMKKRLSNGCMLVLFQIADETPSEGPDQTDQTGQTFEFTGEFPVLFYTLPPYLLTVSAPAAAAATATATVPNPNKTPSARSDCDSALIKQTHTRAEINHCQAHACPSVIVSKPFTWGTRKIPQHARKC